MSADLNPQFHLSDPINAVPEFISDSDPGDESSPSLCGEANARSGTRPSPAPLPSGF